MARRKAPKFYFEPWVVTKSTQHGPNPFPDGPPPEGDLLAERVADAWSRSDRDADWIIWGSKMAEPAICKNLNGSIEVMDDRRIIAIRRTLGLPDGSPDHEAIAKRIASCVNAMAMVGDPEGFITDVRSFLLACAKGECDDPRTDDRVVSLLGRCVPPEEMEQFHADED